MVGGYPLVGTLAMRPTAQVSESLSKISPGYNYQELFTEQINPEAHIAYKNILMKYRFCEMVSNSYFTEAFFLYLLLHHNHLSTNNFYFQTITFEKYATVSGTNFKFRLIFEKEEKYYQK